MEITDTYKARFKGGPLDGVMMDTAVIEPEDLPRVIIHVDSEAAYVLTQYSKLAPDGNFQGVHMMRGARYEFAGSPQFLRYRV